MIELKKLSILFAVILSFFIFLGITRASVEFMHEEVDNTPTTEDHMVGMYDDGNSLRISMIQFLYHSKDFKAALKDYLESEEDKIREEPLSVFSMFTWISDLIMETHHAAAHELQSIFTKLDRTKNLSYVLQFKYGGFPPELCKDLKSDPSEVFKYYSTLPGFNWTTKFGVLSVTFEEQNQPISMSQLIQNRFALNPRGLGDQEILDGIQTAENQFKIKTLPDNLIIQANRFYSDANGVRSKNDSKINIDETIDFAPYLLPELTETITTYELVSFIVHVGRNLKSELYYSIFKRSDGSWVKINNNICSRIGPEQMAKEAKDGYLFMYRKKMI